MFTRATTDIIACGLTLWYNFCLRTAHSAALGCGMPVFFGVPYHIPQVMCYRSYRYCMGWIDSVDSKIQCPADGTTMLPMWIWTQEKSTPRVLTCTNEGGHGYKRRCRCKGSRPLGIDILDQGTALPHAHN